MSNKFCLNCSIDDQDNLTIFYGEDYKGITVGVNVQGEYPHVVLDEQKAIALRDQLLKMFPIENNHDF